MDGPPLDYIKVLRNNGYTIDDKITHYVIRKKLIKSGGVFLIFMFLSIPLVLSGLFLMSEPELVGAGVFLLVFGILLGQVPFFAYLSAPYKSLLVQYEDQSLLFRSRFSRAYQLSELKELKISYKDCYADANPFAESSVETTYHIDMIFAHNNKEELFKIIGRSELTHDFIRGLVNYFETEVFKKRL